MRLNNKAGAWIIILNDNNTKKFCIETTSNIELSLTSGLCMSNNEFNFENMIKKTPIWSLNIQQILEKNQYNCIESIYAITDIDDIIYSKIENTNAIVKFLISKLLIEAGYVPFTEYHTNWLKNKESRYGVLYSKFTQIIQSKHLKTYKAYNIEYKNIDWVQSDFLYDLTVKRETDELIDINRLIGIECALRGISRKELIKSLISEKTYAIYELLRD